MIGYVCLGTNDIAKSAAFYDQLLAVIGAKRTMELDRGIIWGTDEHMLQLGLLTPADGKPATVGNGVMMALVVNKRELVDALYAKALALGGSDEGPPGERSPGFYAAYFRDVEGNKLNAFCAG